jgi:hypothetical protein
MTEQTELTEQTENSEKIFPFVPFVPSSLLLKITTKSAVVRKTESWKLKIIFSVHGEAKL